MVTADGHVYEVGDTDLEFTIQSISKPFVFGMALEDQGRDAVLERVGVEPSGNPFNSIVVDDRNRPFNPMVNAGAIVATGLIDARDDRRARWTRIVDAFSRYAGRRLELDETVYQSESATGDRNRAIAHLMRSFDMLAATSTRSSTRTSGSARCSSPAATSRRWRRRSPTAA